MKFGRLIEYNQINIFLENHAENEAGRLVPDFFFSKKGFIRRLMQVVCSLVSLFPMLYPIS